MTEVSQELNDLSHEVIGGAISVHRELGPGFTPDIYDNAMAVELKLLGLPFIRSIMTDVFYKNAKCRKRPGGLSSQRSTDCVCESSGFFGPHRYGKGYFQLEGS